MSAYPDSDRLSVFPGIEADPLNALRLVRAASVDYWHGEGPVWTTGFPAAVCYPETGEWVLRAARGADEIRLRPG